ncbi:putative interstitial collagenase [Rosa chinensis]|uniref:Putative interstitial collagenase n=1 Tax=Rosa chinensis TaxID=74649 RepID=A0A2P6S516_ROSCH|nr:metalloendoproteinase 3-MMP [Rosa chinensis]PRQ53777.1 putative interstitial collagenase [Rosa chinensis]
MAPKSYLSLFTVTLLLLLLALFSFLCNATANSSPFEVIEHLKGCHKGDKVKGINDLKKYLQKFGYLNYENHRHSNDDDFDEHLEEAVKTYQLNFHLKSTGTLDDKTLSTMMMPRCGVPDIINGTTSMRSAQIKSQHRAIHTTVHFSFPDGNLKWPSSKYHLTYGFLAGTPSEAQGAVAQAFSTWAKNTHFTFSKAQNYQSADLKVSFHKGDHGDGNSFDGPGGQLAHAAYPTEGALHYDADETWSVGAKPGAMDIQSVGLHEIGHLLGLGHSSVEEAIMYPTIPDGVYKSLHEDDIQGIKALYNV